LGNYFFPREVNFKAPLEKIVPAKCFSGGLSPEGNFWEQRGRGLKAIGNVKVPGGFYGCFEA